MALLTRKPAAKMLQIGLRTLDRRVAAGEIQCYRLGDGHRAPVRISEEQIADYLERTATFPQRQIREQAGKVMANP